MKDGSEASCLNKSLDNMEHKKLKVLQIANDYLNTKLYGLLFNALGEIGVNNIVFVPVQRNGLYRKANSEGGRNDTNPIVVPCFTQFDRLVYYSKQKKMLSAIEGTIDLNDIHVTHAHTLFSAGYVAMKMKERYRIPYIVTVRNTDVHIFFKRMKHLRRTGIEVLSNASTVVFLSPAYKRKVIEEYVPKRFRNEIENKCRVIPNGISDVFLDNTGEPHGIDKENIRLIYVGEINKSKNLIETIEAARILNGRGLHVSIMAVGDVTDQSCQKWLDDPLIRHIPKCTQDKLLAYYRQTDIFVMPSHAETFGLVYAEAMSQGLPVIYTRGEGFDGQFPDGEVGYATSDREPEELADRIIQVLDNYEKLSRNALKVVERFRWERIAGEYEEIYKEVGKRLT